MAVKEYGYYLEGNKIAIIERDVAFDNDPVPFFPPYPFLHSGVFIDPETLDWDEAHEEISFLEINANDHSIAEYVNILKKRLEDGN